MTSALLKDSGTKRHRQVVAKQIASLRGQMDDLNDYLTLLEARARNAGKPTHSAQDVRKALGFK